MSCKISRRGQHLKLTSGQVNWKCPLTVPSWLVATAEGGAQLIKTRMICRKRTGEMDHVIVIPCHELNGHVLPSRLGNCVSNPRNSTRGSSIKRIPWAWLTWSNICMDEKRRGKCEQERKCGGGEHFAFRLKKQNKDVVENEMKEKRRR